MTARLAHIFRHPIKSHGREELGEVRLTEGASLPWDRHWAVAHEAARIDRANPIWVNWVSFSRGAKAPDLMAINATFNQDTGQITLTHPDRPALTFRPDTPEGEKIFLDWVRPLCPPERAQPAYLYSVAGRGMTDTNYPSVSLINLGSNADLAARINADLSPLRWRANLWLDGLAPWAEREWVGHRIALGEAELQVTEAIVRCPATSANPATGRIDVDTLGALRTLHDEQVFGVYAIVTRTGTIRCGDRAEVL